jgi:hypothetical protein
MTRDHLRGLLPAAALLALCGQPAPARAQTQTLTLSPAVVPLSGHLGQSVRQTLKLDNATTLPLEFELEAKDVVVRNGARTFVAAGQLAQSIAATAVFSARRVAVPPHQARTVDVTLTLPRAASHRAAVVIFRGLTRIARGSRRTATVSLGTLFTFALSDAIAVAASDVTVSPQTPARNLRFEQTFVNSGNEPVVLKGITVIVDGSGVMVGRVPAAAHRLLPGERAAVRSEYAGELPRGRYRALATYEFEGRAVTRAAEFVVR